MKITRWLMGMLIAILLSTSMLALADGSATLVLPASLEIIEEEAFCGDTSIEKVVVPEGVKEIGKRAFANSSLSEIELPKSLEYIADDAFEGCEEVLFVCEEGSTAYRYALMHTNIRMENKYSLSGAAYYDAEQDIYVLTPNEYWKSGGVWLNSPLTSNEFRISFDFFSGDNVYGADGLVLSFFGEKVTGEGGALLGGGNGGYGVEIDTYYNYPDPSYNHVALVDGNTNNHISISDARAYTEDGKWHNLTLQYNYGKCSVFIDGNKVISEDGIYPKGSYQVGVSASTGASRNFQAIRNLSISEYQHALPTVSNYTLNSAATEITIEEGGTLTFGGAINAGSAQLVNVQASIFKAEDRGQGVIADRIEGIHADTFNLSELDPIIVGKVYSDDEHSYAMEAGKSYVVMLYVSDANGNGFIDHDPNIEGPQGPSILVHVAEKEEADIPTEEVYAKFVDESGNELNNTTLHIDYTGKYSEYLYIVSNTGNISAWSSDESKYSLKYLEQGVDEDGAIRTKYQLIADENAHYSVRMGELRIYSTTDGAINSSSVMYASVLLEQAANPHVQDDWFREGYLEFEIDPLMKSVYQMECALPSSPCIKAVFPEQIDVLSEDIYLFAGDIKIKPYSIVVDDRGFVEIVIDGELPPNSDCKVVFEVGSLKRRETGYINATDVSFEFGSGLSGDLGKYTDYREVRTRRQIGEASRETTYYFLIEYDVDYDMIFFEFTAENCTNVQVFGVESSESLSSYLIENKRVVIEPMNGGGMNEKQLLIVQYADNMGSSFKVSKLVGMYEQSLTDMDKVEIFTQPETVYTEDELKRITWMSQYTETTIRNLYTNIYPQRWEIYKYVYHNIWNIWDEKVGVVNPGQRPDIIHMNPEMLGHFTGDMLGTLAHETQHSLWALNFGVNCTFMNEVMSEHIAREALGLYNELSGTDYSKKPNFVQINELKGKSLQQTYSGLTVHTGGDYQAYYYFGLYLEERVGLEGIRSILQKIKGLSSSLNEEALRVATEDIIAEVCRVDSFYDVNDSNCIMADFKRYIDNL